MRILKDFLGGHAINKHGFFLPSPPPRHVRRPRNTPQELRPDVSIQIPSPRSIEHPIHRGHEAVR